MGKFNPINSTPLIPRISPESFTPADPKMIQSGNENLSFEIWRRYVQSIDERRVASIFFDEQLPIKKKNHARFFKTPDSGMRLKLSSKDNNTKVRFTSK